ncbi:DNA polymerase III subunit gamma/tau [Anaerofustis stercorihominis]|uniref:DNA-directed DNA polymerase n=1 Tax=Anaerofustis stercorihominis DSM 17244 TaxID=445971 RepID=B1C8Q2_9FIRM|nr:DNA polymerase III subunit gamma/tau [Anaerofustis stercorihominis]EDS71962.1 DNA polymerase III, subunit gamma and tau [Anaerofustis stercorihominis DSM 17244]MCQ4796011.1 DNA polymerase III subunit gamma/tau [Anaerofustis stercorihominis]
MSYTVLYREFRPKNFEEIIGQDNIVNILKNQIKNDSISHAYLFSGIRGTGKTSTAKVFAKSICCLNNKEGEACNECASCNDINIGDGADIVEIDAASNRGIDEIRDLKEKVNYMPNFGRYKVYIIDEVHMLTTEAFNALLKTLEEPPSHIVFIFATTEPNKILPTILSRCQRFDFNRIDSEVVVNHLASILDKKEIEYEKEALELIALNTEGALRDALSLLDKAISVVKDNKITKETADDILGLISDEEIFLLAKGILENDVDKSLNAVHDFLNKGREVGSIITQLMEYYSNKIIAVNVKEPEKIINKSSTYISSLKESFNGLEDSKRISDILYSLAKLKNDMRFFSEPEFLFTAKIINLCSGAADNTSDNKTGANTSVNVDNEQIELLNDRIRSLEREVNSLSYLKSEIEKIKNMDFSGGVMPVKEEIIELKDKPKKLAPDSNEIVVDKKEIREADKILSLTQRYIINSAKDPLVGMSVNKFKVISLEDNVLTVYPGEALNMMDFYFDNDGDKIFKDILKEKSGRNLDVVYIDKKIKLRYKNDSSKNSLKSLKKDLNIKNDIKPEPEATSNISVEEDVVSKPPVNDNIASDYNLDEIMSSNEEEYISDEELSQISNEIVVDEDIMDVDEDYDASIMEIFGASEE